MVHDVDRDLGHLVRQSSSSSEGVANVDERLAGLSSQVPETDKLAVFIVGHLSGYEYEPGTGRDDDLGIAQRPGQLVWLYQLESHRNSSALLALKRVCL